jgi:Ras-related protein Rab-8A
MSSSKDQVFKLCLVGDAYVGKSCLLSYTENYIGTIGQEIHWKSTSISNDGKIAELRIWDYEGWHRFRHSNPNTPYPVSFDGIVLVFDLTNHTSFLNLGEYLEEKMRYVRPEIILVGTKSDSDKKREVTDKEIENYADSLGCRYIETSAKNQINVEEVFFRLAQQIAEKNGLSLSQDGNENSDLLSSNELGFFAPLGAKEVDDETVSPKKQLSDNILLTRNCSSCVLL